MNVGKLVDKYRLALEFAQKSKPQGGLCGLELEWNLLDAEMQPMITARSGQELQSFVDFLRSRYLPDWLKELSQLEVFHWMIEWVTHPFYAPRAAIYEGMLLEAMQLNALKRAEKDIGGSLFAWHGNLLYLTPINYNSIPNSWHLAKRRYLERCIDLYGEALATAGTHSNLSLPDPLFTWDYLHLSPTERGDQHLDEYKSEFYITATRLMRAFAAVFVATSASTPLIADVDSRGPVVRLSECDSVRNLTFPNPLALDVPNLYRSYRDYLHLSYDLVRRRVRFGNNNWTPVRARSFAEPVERLIDLTSDQLIELYSHNLFSMGETPPLEEIAHQIEVQNLMARINLPMARVEVRTDDGGLPLEIQVANMTLKHLLLLLFYGDAEFARAFRYDAEDLALARRNEDTAARHGLNAEIQNPLTGKPVAMREFLTWTLKQVSSLAQAMEIGEDLEPLVEMAGGGVNTAQRMRARIRKEIPAGDEVPLELLRSMAEERQLEIRRAVQKIDGSYTEIQIAGLNLTSDTTRLKEFLENAHQLTGPENGWESGTTHSILKLENTHTNLEVTPPDKTGEILALAEELIRVPSVTTGPSERLEEVRHAANFLCDYARSKGLNVHFFDREKYPAMWVTFPSREESGRIAVTPPHVILGGHFDVVPPDPDDSQFVPRLEGDYLWGRGSADMKTVVATFLVWMKDTMHAGAPYPPIGLMLVGNEENGETEPTGTPHIFKWLTENYLQGKEVYRPSLFIAGERTGEKGNELWGEICTQNRGVMRCELVAKGMRIHSGIGGTITDLNGRLQAAQQGLMEIIQRRLTLRSSDGWQSQCTFPFLQVGTPGIYNITPGQGLLGVEIRTIPQDDLDLLEEEMLQMCQTQDLELHISVRENGVECDSNNPSLGKLIEALRQESGNEPAIGRKLAGTSARFTPGGQGVVWGQSGVGPHSADEKHYIPSILPYYRVLDRFREVLLQDESQGEGSH